MILKDSIKTINKPIFTKLLFLTSLSFWIATNLWANTISVIWNHDGLEQQILDQDLE